MKEGWKVTGIVFLLVVFAADFAVHMDTILGCTARNTPADQDKDRRDGGVTNGKGPNGFALAGLDNSKTGEWCNEAARAHEASDGLVWSLISSLKITDVLLVVFTGFLVRVGYRQACAYEDQRALMAGQLDAAKTTAEAALSALNKPWLVLEELSHNRTAWASGSDRLKAFFQIANYGNAPGFIMFVHCGTFLSPGSEMVESFPIKPLPKIMRKFPEPHEVRTLVNETDQGINREYFRMGGEGSEGVYEPIIIDGPQPVPAGDKTISFSVLGHPQIEIPSDSLPMESLAQVFFAGRIGYTGPDEQLEVINFFYAADFKGGFRVIRGAPYNQRKRYPKEKEIEANLGL